MKDTKYRLNLETIRRLIRKEAVQNLRNLLQRLHPMDVAAMCDDLSSAETETLFRHLEDDDTRGLVLAGMNSEPAMTILDCMNQDEMTKILRAMAPDDAAALLNRLPETRISDIENVLSGTELDRVENLLTYPEETAGRIMTPQVFALSGDLTVRQAMLKVREASRAETVFYIYVTDEHKKLLGVVSLRRLLTEDPDAALKTIMLADVITVTPDMDQEEVAHSVARYDLLAIPVVDDAGFLLGIVTVDDVIDIIHEEAREDIYRLAGSNLSEFEMTSPVRMAGVRLKWLFLRFAGSIAGAALFFAFIQSLAGATGYAWAGALFIIFFSLLSGAGTQSAAIVAEQLTLRSDAVTGFWRMLGTECLIGAILGFVIGIVPVCILGLLSEFSWISASMIGCFLIGGMVLATAVGTCLPYTFYKLKKDPAIVTGSVISGALDIISAGVFIAALHIVRLPII
ncbi:magnesium transporter [bacterium]|nr:magnesium transporter [candidate division CSSED10-310 bacterium]